MGANSVSPASLQLGRSREEELSKVCGVGASLTSLAQGSSEARGTLAAPVLWGAGTTVLAAAGHRAVGAPASRGTCAVTVDACGPDRLGSVVRGESERKSEGEGVLCSKRGAGGGEASTSGNVEGKRGLDGHGGLLGRGEWLKYKS